MWNAWHQFVHRPKTLGLRWWMFQIHLWGGVILALYIILVGVSGSILVFREEITALGHPHLVQSPHPEAPLADPATVAGKLREAYPNHKASQLRLPSLYNENFQSFLAGEPTLLVYSDRATGDVIGAIDRDAYWITWMQNLHFYLLLGRLGLIANGVGALCLMLLCVTGLFLWWPGIRSWVRALLVRFRGGWKRINWDLHSAGGFWTLSFVFMWAFTTLFFVWGGEMAAAISWVSKVDIAAPRLRVDPPAEPLPGYDLNELVALAEAREPQHRFSGVQFPANPKVPLRVMMARGDLWDTRATNYLYYDPYRKEYLGTWERGVNKTVGDSFVFLMGPLHFGVYWGMGVKILWAVIGLAYPLLAITGCLMYWNRSLSKLWAKMRQKGRSAATREELGVVEAGD